MGKNYRSIVPEEHYRYLYGPKAIPSGVYVDLGFCPSHSGLSAMQSQTLFGFLLPDDTDKAAQVQRDLYNITLAVGPMLLRTIYFPLPRYSVVASPPFEGEAKRLHPSPGSCSLGFRSHCEHSIEFESHAYFRADNGPCVEA